MLTKKQLKIFESFSDNLSKEYSYKELKNLSEEKSNNAFQIAMKKFKEEQLIIEKKIGTSRLYTLNKKNDVVYDYFSIINQTKIQKLVYDIIQKLMLEIDKFTLFYSLIIFGSYVTNTQNKNSDLDIAIIIENKIKENQIKTAFNTINNISLIKIDAHIITQEEFLEMLKVDYENLAKQIARKNLPVYNINIFYKIINKGVEDGFKY